MVPRVPPLRLLLICKSFSGWRDVQLCLRMNWNTTGKEYSYSTKIKMLCARLEYSWATFKCGCTGIVLQPDSYLSIKPWWDKKQTHLNRYWNTTEQTLNVVYCKLICCSANIIFCFNKQYNKAKHEMKCGRTILQLWPSRNRNAAARKLKYGCADIKTQRN